MTRSGKAPHADAVYSTLNSAGAGAASLIAASWSRSLVHYGLDPDRDRPPERLSQAEFDAACERAGSLIDQSKAELDRLFRMVGEAGCCVLLTDRDGVPLERRALAGDNADFRRLGLWTGMIWSEASGGTNGIGTCLAESRPLTVHREQHFLTRNTGLSCSAAPIFDAHGRLCGALDVSTCRFDLSTATLKLIAAATIEAAQRIEASQFHAAFNQARIVMAETGRCGGALLAVDREDLVVGANRAARLAFGLTDQRLATPFPANSLLRADAPGAMDDLSAGERGVLQRALARAKGNVSAASRALGVSRATMHRKMARLGLHRPH
ncbi:MAG: GAF domain-containing protein [Pseudomonadota bacterium]